jgi:RNA polymerase sigma-70 factor (ECF subfamily)
VVIDEPKACADTRSSRRYESTNAFVRASEVRGSVRVGERAWTQLGTRVVRDHLQPKEMELISEALTMAPGTIGFRSRTALDESPQARSKTSLAVARAKEGDQDALRFLYVTYSQNVYGYVRSIVRDDHEAEDVTQHVFAKLMTSVAKYDERGVPFFAWLLRLARNVAIDHLRSNRMLPTEEVLDPNAILMTDVDHADTVRAALATLPDEQRQVVLMRHVVGLTPGEIADRMGRSEGSIHGLHHRGRRALQRELARLESTPCTRRARRLAAA